MRRWVLVLLILLALFIFALGIFLLAPFPIAIFPNLVKSQVYLQEKSNGDYPKATYYWTSLPATQYFDFYFFNITNPDEVLYYNAKPQLVQVGPYSYAETEFKEDIIWSEDKTHVYYKNNKTWIWNEENSCSTCGYADVLTLPNAAYMSLLYMTKTSPTPPAAVMLLDVLSLILGEYPIRTVPMAGVTFESYDDPLIDLLNSELVKVLLQILGNPVQLPNIPAMGYFPLYNHTNDEDYVLTTGKGNTDLTGLIQEWANMTHLPWWGDNYTQDITQSTDGTIQKPNVKKTDRLKQFQSFACRAFYLDYDSKETVNGISSLKFKMDKDEYDSTLPKNKGYRYENMEKVDYFPSWPCNSSHVYNYTSACNGVDCSLKENWCTSCCNGSHLNGTVFLPPGIVPLRCLPGQTIPLPFAGFLSPPHFAWSPPEIPNTMVGLQPDLIKHDPAAFNIQPLTGSTVGAYFRMQLSIPIYNDKGFTTLRDCQNSFLPSFWLNIRVVLRDYATNYVKFNTSTLPKIFLGVGIGLVSLSVLDLLLIFFCVCRKRLRKGVKAAVVGKTYSTQSWE